ncbi:MAG TPA: hypothetical protein PKO06_11785 [Candidatus Ozemobacteraceae bacterium]|nr:hypothetical protein [Candidatus Ozemobacteraceae bacterium]
MRGHWWLVALLMVSSSALGVQAAPIDDFLAFNERFYYLDRQSVGTISARLECPALINSMKTLREQLAHMQKAVSITGEPASYTLTYHPQHGLKLNPPELKVEQIASEGVKNQETFARGLEQVRGGIQQQLEGIVQTITSIFEGMTAPVAKDYQVESIVQNGEVWTMKYTDNEGPVVATFSGTMFEKNQMTPGDTIRSREEYKSNDAGKLLLSRAQVTIENAMACIELEMTMTYEQVGGIQFPVGIVSAFAQKIQTMEQKGTVEIFLKDLKLATD